MKYLMVLFVLVSAKAFATSYAVCDFTEGKTKGVARIDAKAPTMQTCSSRTSHDCRFVFSGNKFPTIDEIIALKECGAIINDTVSSGVFIRYSCEPDALAPKYLDLEASGRIFYYNAGFRFRHYDPDKNEIIEKIFKFENCDLY